MRILVTAGPTRERLDDVRFISNFSTGKMGYEIAKAAAARGHRVTLISGPTHLAPPKGARFIGVESALEMKKAVDAHFSNTDCLFMASAVSDWRPQRKVAGKTKKAKGESATSLKLLRNPDIVGRAGRQKARKIVVGFALEAGPLISNAKQKLKDKNLDLIVANRLGRRSPFGEGPTSAVIIDRLGKTQRISNVAKRTVAVTLLGKAEGLWEERR